MRLPCPLLLFLILECLGRVEGLARPTTRRESIVGAGACTTLLSIGTAAASLSSTPAAQAAVDNPMAQVNELLSRLHNIPTFCIVAPDGAAYMVFKNDQAMAIGYAFTTFEGALAVLGDAQRVAKEKGYYDVWENATITTIPLDVAIRLALKKRQRVSQKGQSLDTLLMVIPGAVRVKDYVQEVVDAHTC